MEFILGSKFSWEGNFKNKISLKLEVGEFKGFLYDLKKIGNTASLVFKISLEDHFKNFLNLRSLRILTFLNKWNTLLF